MGNIFLSTDYPTDPKVSIQFSYPVVDNIIYDTGRNNFFLPNNSVGPNFSYTDGNNNLYISGATIKGYIRQNNPATLTNYPRELVLEHQQANSDGTFLVVIPINPIKTSKTSLSKLNSQSATSLDLNSDIIMNQNKIYHYLGTDNRHVFVFHQPITVNSNFSLSGGAVTIPAPAPSGGQKYTINPTKVEDEVVCSYSEDASAKPAEDKITTTTTYSFAMLFLNIVLISICIHLIIMNDGGLIRKILLGSSFVSFIILLVLTIVYKKHTNYMIVTGSLMFTSVLVFVLSGMALMRPNYTLFNKPTVAAPPPVAKPIFGLGFLKKP